MKRIDVFGESVQGASHKRMEMECQDSRRSVQIDDGTILLAVADGHGSKACPFSKSGASIAVNVFMKTMTGYFENYAGNPDLLLTYLNREGDTKVAQAIDAEWKKRVLKAHTDQKRDVPCDENGDKDKGKIYALYGTTLVGLVICKSFIFAFQLGDGDIVYVDNEGVSPVLQSERILGVETHSLSRIDSWKKAISTVKRMEAGEKCPCVFMLSTDGFANSYKNGDEYEKTCLEYFQMLNEHGADVVKSNLRNWLFETSEMGCGDDITLLMAYYSDAECYSSEHEAENSLICSTHEDANAELSPDETVTVESMVETDGQSE